MYGGDAVHGWRWDLNLGIMMQVRKVRYGGETYIFIPWCVSNGTWMKLGRCRLGTWMEVRHHLDGGETRVSGPFWRWDWTWISVRCEFSDLDGDNVLCGDGTRIFETWIQLRRDLSEVELFVIRPVWISNGIWMELRCNYLDMGWGEMRPGWSSGVNLWPLIELGQDVDWGDTNISTVIGVRWDLHAGGPYMFIVAWRCDATSLEVRRNYQHLDGGEMLPE